MATPRNIRLIGAVVLCVCAATGTLWYRGTGATQARSHISLWVPEEALNIGDVWENEDLAVVLPIENRGTSEAVVKEFSRTCNCVTVTPNTFVLQPHERIDLRLEVDISTTTGKDLKVGLRPILAAEPGGRKESMPAWKLVGRVRRPLKFERSVFLGRHSEFAQPLPAWTIPVEVLTPLESIDATCDDSRFVAKVDIPEKMGNAVLRLTQKAVLPVGAFEGTVILRPRATGGEVLPVRRLRFQGQIVSDIESIPPIFQVGSRQVGDTINEEVVLQSLTNRRFVIVQTETEGDGLSVEVLERNRRYRVKQRACAIGTQNNRVRFHGESEGRRTIFVLPVHYSGIASN